jgi:hypothetical protein
MSFKPFSQLLGAMGFSSISLLLAAFVAAFFVLAYCFSLNLSVCCGLAKKLRAVKAHL